MNKELATVFVVDDDEAVRGSLKLLLKTLGLPVQTYASAQEFLDGFDPRRSGCLVLDIRMPGMSGLELQEELNSRGAMLPIIFITGHGDVPMAVEAMQRGAMDFLQKPFRDQELLDRINKALEKDRAGRELLGNRERIRARIAQLTPREQQVMALVTQGKANKVIAADLELSQRTVEIHRAHLMEKMGANSLAHLVRMVIDAEQDSAPPR
ncbi:MAG TPA: response regulator [Steroidobacteraceae bacterium]|jgi:FixJ family two-component response regulator|nr:response regulator [Steroidobacteraceae bacterium]